jgi:hypothetical protein
MPKQGIGGHNRESDTAKAKPVPEITLSHGSLSRDFEPVAELLTPKPPAWLAEQLYRWAPSVRLDQAVQMHQPSRADMRTNLAKINSAAELLSRELAKPAVREFLEPRTMGPIQKFGYLQRMLLDICDRAERASQSPALVNAEGQTKAGKGRAVPEGTSSPQVYCALVIAETWKFFKDNYPGSRNAEAARAAEEYWRLAGCERQSWGDKPLNAWRRHFEEAASQNMDELRREYIRHLNESAAHAAMLEPETQPDPGL